MNTMMRKSDSHGFTLIELLVVIAVVGVVSSIVVASVNNARESGRVAAGKAFDSHMYQAYGAEAVGVWNFDESSGSTLYDISGSNANFTLNASTVRVSGVHNANTNSAIQFTSGTVLTSSSAVQFSDTWTLAAWVKADALGNSIFMSFGLPYLHFQPNGAFRVSWADTTTQRALSEPSGGRQTGRWYHVAATHAGMVTTLYVDGKQVATTSLYDSRSTNTALRIGSHDSTHAYDFLGTLDDVRVYTESLVAADIYKIYVEGRPAHMLASAE